MENQSRQYLNQEASTQLIALAKSHGALAAHFAPLAKPLSLSIYEAWLAKEFHGSMSYLERHLPIKAEPRLRWPNLNSCLVLLVPYPQPPAERPLKNCRTALYSHGEDYHHYFVEQFQAFLEALREQFPEEEFLLVTDSIPLMERDLAYQAGLGWFGKNSCLISRDHGSLFLIAEILTTLPVQVLELKSPDFCGSCTRCIDACPTTAIEENRTIDAKKCISYWTIESKEIPPVLLREKFGSWLFGCDICQTVCPWNQKVFGKQEMQRFTDDPDTSEAMESELRWILTATAAELKEHLSGTALVRSKAFGLKRNALIVVANTRCSRLIPEVSRLLEDPQLKDLAQWTLERLKN